MSGFLIVIIALNLAVALGKLIWLASGKFPERRPALEAIDVGLSMFLAAWAFFLLVL